MPLSLQTAEQPSRTWVRLGSWCASAIMSGPLALGTATMMLSMSEVRQPNIVQQLIPVATLWLAWSAALVMDLAPRHCKGMFLSLLLGFVSFLGVVLFVIGDAIAATDIR